MIRKILLIQICIISAFGQVIQELNGSQLSSDSASLGFDGTEPENGLKPKLTKGQQLTANNESKTQNKSTNAGNINNNQTNSTVELRKKSILTTLTVMVNMTSKVVTQTSVFDVINAKEAKTLSPIGKKTHNFTNGNLKINEKKTKNSISEFPADFMSDEVSDRFSLV
jgi:hypothetical protein